MSRTHTIYSNAGQPFGLALDVESQILYYSNRETNQVHSISTLGGESSIMGVLNQNQKFNQNQKLPYNVPKCV
ncbi:MAG: hypothetical protein ACI8YQ_003767 [Polaribacter sp.]|jgi:hypothetical protein